MTAITPTVADAITEVAEVITLARGIALSEPEHDAIADRVIEWCDARQEVGAPRTGRRGHKHDGCAVLAFCTSTGVIVCARCGWTRCP